MLDCRAASHQGPAGAARMSYDIHPEGGDVPAGVIVLWPGVEVVKRYQKMPDLLGKTCLAGLPVM